MRERSLKDLIRQVLSGGLAVSSASQALPAMPAPAPVNGPIEPRSEVAPLPVSRTEIILKKAQPRVLLRALDATRIALVSSHRSHRSHSSHYSSSSGGGSSKPPAPPKRDTTSPESRPQAAPRPQGLHSGSAVAAESIALGSRVLRRGMTGKDVDQLIMLLVKGSLLSPVDIPQSSLFTEQVERAVKKFQDAKRLPSDGVVDYRTLLLLKIQ